MDIKGIYSLDTQYDICKYINKNDLWYSFTPSEKWFENDDLNKLFNVLIQVNKNRSNGPITSLSAINQHLIDNGIKTIQDDMILNIIEGEYTSSEEYVKKWYDEWVINSTIKNRLKEVNSLMLSGKKEEALKLLNIDTASGNEVSEEDFEEINTPILEDTIFDILPTILKEIIDNSNYDTTRERDVYLLSTLSALSSVLDNIFMVWYKGKTIDRPNIYTYIAAPSGSGKGVMGAVINLLHLYREYESEMNLKNSERFYSDENNKKLKFVNKCLVLPGNSSKAALFEKLKNNEGKCLLFETESESMSSNNKNDWGNLDSTLNGAYHNESISNNRKDSDPEWVNNPYISLSFSGTIESLILMLNKSIQNGMVSRISYYTFNSDSKYKRDDYNDYNESYFDSTDEAFKHYSKDILNIYFYFNKLYSQECNKLRVQMDGSQRKAFDDILEPLFNNYVGIYGTDMESVAKRMTTMTRKLIMILTILRKYSDNKDYIINEIKNSYSKIYNDAMSDKGLDRIIAEKNNISSDLFDVVPDVSHTPTTYDKLFTYNSNKRYYISDVDDKDIQIALSIVQTLGDHSKYIISTIQKLNPENNRIELEKNTHEEFYNKLPDVFNYKTALKVGYDFGLNNERSVQRKLKKYVANKIIKRLKKGEYQKITK